MNLRDQLQERLGSAYVIEEELGGGGMSRVFVAEERALGRRVVVKVLPVELSGGVNIDRFRREIRLAAQLQHPHIVPVLTAGELDGLPYYTMPLEQGQSLRGRLVSTGALPIADTMAILGDVAKALAYAHAQGVVHRDIKPDNVLVCGDAAVVTDFGIAKALSDATEQPQGALLTQVGMTMGTPAYMAPEQAAADPTMDHRADIYAFGCLAYELLTGRPPFVYSSPRKLLAAQMSEVPAVVESLRSETPSLLSALVMRCLAKEPDDRPQHATELVRALDRLATGEHTSAMPAVAPRQRLARTLLLYGLAFIPVAIVVKATMIILALPEWVLPVSMAGMVLGLPIVATRRR
jgi:eukaryotic-like serine/threonine-protein kinase